MIHPPKCHVIIWDHLCDKWKSPDSSPQSRPKLHTLCVFDFQNLCLCQGLIGEVVGVLYLCSLGLCEVPSVYLHSPHGGCHWASLTSWSPIAQGCYGVSKQPLKWWWGGVTAFTTPQFYFVIEHISNILEADLDHNQGVLRATPGSVLRAHPWQCSKYIMSGSNWLHARQSGFLPYSNAMSLP